MHSRTIHAARTAACYRHEPATDTGLRFARGILLAVVVSAAAFAVWWWAL